MVHTLLALSLPLLVALSSGVPAGERGADGRVKRQLTGTLDICPMVMCASQLHHSEPCSVPLVTNYFRFNGKDCPGCSSCPTASTSDDVTQDQKRQLTIALDVCPSVLCAAAPGPCAVPLQTSVFHYNGKDCPACSFCPTGTSASDDVTEDQKRQLIGWNVCPVVLCANPGPCSVPLQQSVVHHNGMDCPGCPVCPTASTSDDVTEDQKRQLIGWNVCPVVRCANPGPCIVPLQQSVMHHNGMDCPGCPVCPTASTSDDATEDQKRQLTHILDICPIFECARPAPCSVPRQPGTILVNGKECPACSICPTA